MPSTKRKINDISSDALTQTLQEYESNYPNGIGQLIASIPGKEAWRFFIDGRHQETGESWVHYEIRESGYLLAMSSAFGKMLDYICSSTQLSLSVIKTLHFIALSNIHDTNYSRYGSMDNSDFNNIFNFGVNLRVAVVSKEGLFEILNRIKNGNPLLGIEYSFVSGFSRSGVTTTHRLIRHDNIYKHEDLYVLAEEIKGATHIRTCRSIGEDENLEVYLKTANLFFNQLIDSFNSSIQDIAQPENKLKHIVEFITECEQSHPYIDGNGRTFCTLLLNFLLIKSNFPPVIMHNPNLFDGLDQETLIDEVIKGMQNTLLLAKNKKIFDQTTEDILEKCGVGYHKRFDDSYDILKKHFDKPTDANAESKTETRPMMTRLKLNIINSNNNRFFHQGNSRTCADTASSNQTSLLESGPLRTEHATFIAPRSSPHTAE